MAYRTRRRTSRSTYRTARRSTRRRAAPRRASRRRAAPRGQKIVIQLVGAPTGTMVSTATLGKKSGRPVRARF